MAQFLNMKSKTGNMIESNIFMCRLTLDLQREVEAGKSIIDTLKREQNWLKKDQESNEKV